MKNSRNIATEIAKFYYTPIPFYPHSWWTWAKSSNFTALLPILRSFSPDLQPKNGLIGQQNKIFPVLCPRNEQSRGKILLPLASIAQSDRFHITISWKITPDWAR